MPSTEEQVKSVILKHKSSASKQQIAQELKMGLDYIDFVCRDLERKGKIALADGSYSLITSDHKPRQRRPSVLRGKPRKSLNEVRKVYVGSALLGITGMTKGLIDVLKRMGYKTIESLADAPIAKLMQETKLELREAAGLINQARRRVAAMAEHGKESPK